MTNETDVVPESITDEIIWLNKFEREFGNERLIRFVAERNNFLNTRIKLYKRALVDANIDPATVIK